ncbi:MAG TPA: thioesterase [Thauera sp.]|nr:thioesterase [Thauera sp.]HHW65933.1 thioesterase [Rhodocyclaceae bacterium]
MPRIRIDLPDRFPFSTTIPLLISHINYGNHLDNAQLLGIVSEARLRLLKSLGYTELDIEGVGIIVADAALQYRSEAFHGESMRVEMAASDFNAFGCDLVWRMSEAEGGREVARGKTGIVFFDYRTRSKAPTPAGFRAHFA